MKPLPEKKALETLDEIRKDLRSRVSAFESRAKDCGTCETKGECCTDGHFVNVHVTMLEARSILLALDHLPPDLRQAVIERNRPEAEKMMDATESVEFSTTYSCPLFEPAVGCLVHYTAKPLPCIHHACYDDPKDLPPDELLENAENEVSRLNSRVYGNAWNWQPIPLWLAGSE